MTAYSWTGVSGDWNVAADWSPSGGPPKSTDPATIGGTGTYTVTVDSADVAKSLTLSDANATLNDDGASASLTISGALTMSNGTLNVATLSDTGALTVNGALNLSGGALTLNSGGTLTLGGTLSQTGGTLTLSGGTISGGTIKSTAGTLNLNSGTLSGTTFDGPLNLTATYATVHLANGATVVGSSGSGPGTINDTGYYSYLYFDNTQTVSNETINLGNASYYDYLYGYDTTGAGTVLTVASSVTVDVVGYAYISSGYSSGDGIVNQGVIDQTGGALQIAGNAFTNSGTIDVNASSGSLNIDPYTFTNSGTIDVANGETVYLDPTTFTTTASSLITIEANSSVTIEPSNAWTNLGSITLASGANLYLYGTMSAASLGSISNSGGTVYVAGTYDDTGHTLDGSASFGQLALYGGTITGGTATSAGVAFTNYGGTLSGVTFDGPLNLTTDYASIQLANGTTVVGSGGSGPGTINDTALYSDLYFDNSQTVSNTTINLGNAIGYYDYLYGGYDPTGAGGQILTLASSVTVDVVGYAYISSSYYSGDGIVNQGVIDQTAGALQIYGNAFTNGGTIDANGASSLYIGPTTFTNSGALDVANGEAVTIAPGTFTTTASSLITIEANSSVTIEPVDPWTNLGSITLAGGASLYLYGSTSAAGLGSVSNSGGTVYVAGTYDNTGQTLDGSASFGQLFLYGGTITGGTTTSSGVAFTGSGGTLSGVTFDGPLNLTDYAAVGLANGTTVVGSGGSGPGTINDTALYSDLFFDNTQTVSNTTINLGNSSGNYDYLYGGYDATGAGAQVLTLASSVTVDVVGYAYISSSYYSGDGIINQGVIDLTGGAGSLVVSGNAFTNSGTIDANATGGAALSINPNTFTNNGTIDVANGDTVVIAPTTFTNLPSHTLTGGTYEVEAGSTLQVDGFASITTLNADVILSGAGSQFLDQYTGAVGTPTLDSLLRTIGASGELELLAGRNWTTANAAITNNGVIHLVGTTLTSTGASESLTNAAGAKIIGAGTVTAKTLTNSGTVEASGGTLTLTNAVGGTGSLKIDANATLVLASATATTDSATFNGAGATLTLNHTGNLSGAIAGIGLDDTFSLIGVTANGASVNGSNQLVVTQNGTTVDTLQLSGSNSGFYFLTQAIGGGTNVIALPIPASVADYLDVPALYDQIPGGFAISDAASAIAANIGSLNDTHIASITATGGTVTVSCATFLASGTALDKVVGGFAISDTAADICADLDQLTDAKLTSITISDSAAVGVTVAQLTSDATQIGKLANANASPYQLAVTDTATDITAGLDGLDGSHIGSITISDNGAIGVSVAQLTSDATAIGKLANANASQYQLAVTDTAANITGALDSLNGSHIGSITISDNAAIGVNVAQLTSDATAIGELANANASAYQLTVTDTAADISAGLDGLDGSHIASITISDNGAIGVNVAQLTSDATAIGKLANANATAYQLAVTDTAADISAGLNGLNGSHIASITISDNGAIGLSVAQLTSDATAIGKLANANATAYQLAVTDSLSTIIGDLSGLNGNSHVASLTATSGAATLSSGTIAAGAFTLTGASTALTLAENLTYTKTFTEGAGSTVSISTGDTLTLKGTTSLSGKVTGAGTLALGGGSATIGAGASLTVANLKVSGSGNSVTLGENLSYAGTFTASSGTTLNLGGDILTLTGTDSFAGTSTGGSGQISAKGTSTLSGLTVGGTTVFDVIGSLSQSGGSAVVGDAFGDIAKAIIGAAGTWNILDDSAIKHGSATTSSLTNAGLLEKTGGTGVSLISPKVTNNGKILVSSGTLDFKAVGGTGTDTISGSSTLEFDAKVSTSTTIGAQTIGFLGGGGTLDLLSPKSFYGEISGFAAGDAIDLLGSWAFSGISDVSGTTTLTLITGKTKHAFTFAGDYAQGDFHIASGATTVITHT